MPVHCTSVLFSFLFFLFYHVKANVVCGLHCGHSKLHKTFDCWIGLRISSIEFEVLVHKDCSFKFHNQKRDSKVVNV